MLNRAMVVGAVLVLGLAASAQTAPSMKGHSMSLTAGANFRDSKLMPLPIRLNMESEPMPTTIYSRLWV